MKNFSRSFFQIKQLFEAEDFDSFDSDSSSFEDGEKTEKPKVKDNKVNLNQIELDNLKREIINLNNYFISVLFDETIFKIVNKEEKRTKILSKVAEELKEIIKTKINSIYKEKIKKNQMNTEMIQKIIDLFDFTRIKSTALNVPDSLSLFFNKRQILKFLFIKKNNFYILETVDVVENYNKKQISYDYNNFVLEIVFGQQGKKTK